jgi:hypothetical protein
MSRNILVFASGHSCASDIKKRQRVVGMTQHSDECSFCNTLIRSTSQVYYVRHYNRGLPTQTWLVLNHIISICYTLSWTIRFFLPIHWYTHCRNEIQYCQGISRHNRQNSLDNQRKAVLGSRQFYERGWCGQSPVLEAQP